MLCCSAIETVVFIIVVIIFVYTYIIIIIFTTISKYRYSIGTIATTWTYISLTVCFWIYISLAVCFWRWLSLWDVVYFLVLIVPSDTCHNTLQSSSSAISDSHHVSDTAWNCHPRRILLHRSQHICIHGSWGWLKNDCCDLSLYLSLSAGVIFLSGMQGSSSLSLYLFVCLSVCLGLSSVLWYCWDLFISTCWLMSFCVCLPGSFSLSLSLACSLCLFLFLSLFVSVYLTPISLCSYCDCARSICVCVFLLFSVCLVVFLCFLMPFCVSL